MYGKAKDKGAVDKEKVMSFIMHKLKHLRERWHRDLYSRMDHYQRSIVGQVQALRGEVSSLKNHSFSITSSEPYSHKDEEKKARNLQQYSELRLESYCNKDLLDTAVQVNRSHYIENDRYLKYLTILNSSEGLSEYWDAMPAGTFEWWLKIKRERCLNGDNGIYHLFPSNVIDHAIGYALFMAILKRLPESITVINMPPKLLCNTLLNSSEYELSNRKTIEAWLKS